MSIDLVWTRITEMTPYYKALTSIPGSLITLHPETLSRMDTANHEALKQLDERVEEAEKKEERGKQRSLTHCVLEWLIWQRLETRLTHFPYRFISFSPPQFYLGCLDKSSRICTRKNTWCWFQDRYHAHLGSNRILLRWPITYYQELNTSRRVNIFHILLQY